MKREKLTPKDKADWLKMRSQDVTSTEVSALFGLSPYTTEFELWYKKKEEKVDEIEPTERMRWGTRLESAIAHGIAEDNAWAILPFKDYMRIPELKMGSSFDFLIEDKPALLEIKNVDALQFKEKWEVDDDNIEAPPHIELQAQYQMLVSNISELYIAALISGNQLKLIKREIDEDIQKSIQEKVFKFWESIRKGIAPSPDFTRDAKFISNIYKNVRAGSVIESITDDRLHTLAENYRLASEQEKAGKEAKEAAKAEILTLMEDAEKVRGETFSISAGIVKGGPVSYVRDDYRNFRVTFKKEKKNE